MRKAVYDIACRFTQEHTTIIDLGASRGEAIAPLISKFGAHNDYVLVEVSKYMRDACKRRFRGYISANVVKISDVDLRLDFPQVRSSVVLSVLTLQFVPLEYRQRIVRDIFNSLLPNGAFIFVEKILGENDIIDKLFVDLYYKLKAENNYTEEQIQRKRLSLEGVLVPLTDSWNRKLLTDVGFRSVDCFWRWMNFTGYVALK